MDRQYPPPLPDADDEDFCSEATFSNARFLARGGGGGALDGNSEQMERVAQECVGGLGVAAGRGSDDGVQAVRDEREGRLRVQQRRELW